MSKRKKSTQFNVPGQPKRQTRLSQALGQASLTRPSSTTPAPSYFDLDPQAAKVPPPAPMVDSTPPAVEAAAAMQPATQAIEETKTLEIEKPVMETVPAVTMPEPPAKTMEMERIPVLPMQPEPELAKTVELERLAEPVAEAPTPSQFGPPPSASRYELVVESGAEPAPTFEAPSFKPFVAPAAAYGAPSFEPPAPPVAAYGAPSLEPAAPAPEAVPAAESTAAPAEFVPFQGTHPHVEPAQKLRRPRKTRMTLVQEFNIPKLIAETETQSQMVLPMDNVDDFNAAMHYFTGQAPGRTYTAELRFRAAFTPIQDMKVTSEPEPVAETGNWIVADNCFTPAASEPPRASANSGFNMLDLIDQSYTTIQSNPTFSQSRQASPGLAIDYSQPIAKLPDVQTGLMGGVAGGTKGSGAHYKNHWSKR